MDTAKVATAGLLGVSYLIAHNVADHWLQTHWESCNKSRKDFIGRAACLSHVVTYTLVIAAVVSTLTLIFHLPVTWYGILAGLATSAVTHYWADRRYPLEKLTQLMEKTHGKHTFYKLGQPRDVRAYEIENINKVELCVANGDAVPWDNPSLGTGAYVLDQSWHWFWILVATIVTVVV
jgi:hypothetical protein